MLLNEMKQKLRNRMKYNLYLWYLHSREQYVTLSYLSSINNCVVFGPNYLKSLFKTFLLLINKERQTLKSERGLVLRIVCILFWKRFFLYDYILCGSFILSVTIWLAFDALWNSNTQTLKHIHVLFAFECHHLILVKFYDSR